jgi:hypothetical protein
MEQEPWARVPMQRINYEKGENADRFVLLVVTKRFGGDPVTPLYEQQARRLMKEQREAGFLTQLIRLRPDGSQVVESDL